MGHAPRSVSSTSATKPAPFDAAELTARLLAIPHRPKLRALSPPPSPPETWTQGEEDGPNSVAFVDLIPQTLVQGDSGEAASATAIEHVEALEETRESEAKRVLLLPGTESAPCIIVVESPASGTS